jgi:hypothetical protein
MYPGSFVLTTATDEDWKSIVADLATQYDDNMQQQASA